MAQSERIFLSFIVRPKWAIKFTLFHFYIDLERSHSEANSHIPFSFEKKMIYPPFWQPNKYGLPKWIGSSAEIKQILKETIVRIPMSPTVAEHIIESAWLETKSAHRIQNRRNLMGLPALITLLVEHWLAIIKFSCSVVAMGAKFDVRREASQKCSIYLFKRYLVWRIYVHLLWMVYSNSVIFYKSRKREKWKKRNQNLWFFK